MERLFGTGFEDQKQVGRKSRSPQDVLQNALKVIMAPCFESLRPKKCNLLFLDHREPISTVLVRVSNTNPQSSIALLR